MATEPGTLDHAKQLAAKLESLDGDFKDHHFQLIDLIDDTDVATLTKEQEGLTMIMITIRLQQLLSAKPGASSPSTSRKTLSRKLSHLEK